MRSKSVIHRWQGFTLIELLIAMAISTIVVGVLTSVFIDSWGSQAQQEAYAQLQQSARSATEEVAIYARQASAVESSVVLNGTTYSSDYNVLVLRLSSLDANNNILSTNDYVIFRLRPSNPTTLERLIFADPTSSRASLAANSSVSKEISNLTFTYAGTGGPIIVHVGDFTKSTTVTISASASRLVKNRTISRSFELTVKLRNTIVGGTNAPPQI